MKASKRSPVVMIHGAFCGRWAFEHWRPLFETRGYDVHLPVLRYHDKGRNPPTELGTTSLLDYADDLAASLKKLGEPAFLIGHSMGGLLVQMLAARCDVRAIACLAPSPPYGIMPSTHFEIASAQALFFAGDFWNRPLKPDKWIAQQNSLDLLSPAEADAVFAKFVPESGLATFEIMQWGLDTKQASFVDADRVTSPVLCLAGTRDKVNPPGTVYNIAQRYKKLATFEELSNHSHWLIGEPGWEKIAQRVADWFETASHANGTKAKAS
jgi:pimeloyl-ACP methyl ester carboxylesterase